MTTVSLAHAPLRNLPSPTGLAVVILAHGAILALLVALEIVPVPVALTTLTVDLIQPTTQPETPRPQPRPVDQRPPPAVRPHAVPAPPVLARPADDSPAAALQPTDPTPSAPAIPPAPPALAAPRFDAAYLNNPAPAYPSLSRRLGEEGRTVLRVLVDPDGHPSQIQINRSSGSSRLDNAAGDAVGRWKFVPARQGKEAVEAWVLVPITFSLKD